MPKIMAIAWREFSQTVLRKVFLLAVFGIPVLVIGITALATLAVAGHEEPPLIGTIALIDPTGELTEAAKFEFAPEEIEADQRRAIEQQTEALENLGPGLPTSGAPPQIPEGVLKRGEVRITFERINETGDETIEQLKSRIQQGTLLAAAIIGDQALIIPDEDDDLPRARFELFVAPDVDSDHVTLIENRLGQAAVRVRAQRMKYDPREVTALLKRPRADTKRVSETGEVVSESQIQRQLTQTLVPMAFMMLIWIGTLTSSQHLMMSTIEEKSNRVMEVLLSAVSPLQLMTGKILGHGAVGLLIVLIYSSVGVVALLMLSAMHFINPLDLLLLAVFYIMAYFMIASMMAAVGSAVSDIREANTLITPVMMIVMIPLILWMPITQAPNGPIATACSFVPPAIPFAMILRAAADEPVPVWQYPASIVWGFICVVGMIWMAGKIFRVGVLMYGKPPSPVELIKWLRYS